MKLAKPLIVLDLETTGTWVEKDRIVEIAMIRRSLDGGIEKFCSRGNPGMPIPPTVSQIIGIVDADVRDAPTFKAIAPTALAFMQDTDLAGFNIERFDLPILEREMFEAGLKLDWRTRTIYDAQKIYHLHEKRNLKAAFGFYCAKELVNAHTAMGDAEATVEILAAQIQRYGDPLKGLESLRDFDYQRIDDYFDEERKFRWWNGELFPVFGKYARKSSLKEIAQKDPEYLQWLLTTDFSDKVKKLLKEILAAKV